MTGILRFLVISPLAIVITLLLLAIMVGMVETADKSINLTKRIKIPDIHMPDIQVEVYRSIEKPEKPKIDPRPPPDIPKQDFEKVDGNTAISNIDMTSKLDVKLDLGLGEGLQATDGEYLPIVKVAPQYPARALRRGIEGYVILEYTVTKHGSVKEPIIIEAEPKNIFDKAAINSTLKYKYKPRVIVGEPIEVSGVQTKIIFELEK